MRYYAALFILSFLLSCRERNPATPQTRNIHKHKQVNPALSDSGDEYRDSTSLSWNDNRNLLIIHKESTDSGTVYVHLAWYNDINGRWELKTEYRNIELVTEYYNPTFRDMNGDGIPDLILSIGSGMRGGNEFFHLFFANPASRKLEKAHGIEWIVNPMYDSSTRRIESMSLHGSGCTIAEYTILNGDSLLLFSVTGLRVEDGTTFQEKTFYNKKGKISRIQKDSLKDGGEHSFSPW